MPRRRTRPMAIETLGAALRQIDRLFADGAVTGLSDRPAPGALRRAGTTSTAFEAMVARHGPMVLRVCRGILRDPNDAEDAFQAVFLVLVKKAGTIRGRVHPGRLAVPGGAPRGDRGQPRRGPAARPRKGGGTDGCRDGRRPARLSRTTCCRPCTRRSPGCPRSTGWPSSSATWRACPRPRPPGSCTGASGPSAVASPRPATGSRPG